MRRIILILLIFVLFLPIAKTFGEEKQKQGLDGAKVFRNNCNRCHNYRYPNERSDTQWEIIVTHMRVRAQLTEEEAMAVLEFLKKAN